MRSRFSTKLPLKPAFYGLRGGEFHHRKTIRYGEFAGRCIHCATVMQFTLVMDDVYDYLRGKLIQEAFPDLIADHREMLISGICPKCQDAAFGDIGEDFTESEAAE